MQLWDEIEKNYQVSIKRGEDMAGHCSYELGGPADYFCEPADVQALIAVLRVCREQHIPVTIIGKGSNLLVADKGIRGMVICLAGALARQGYLKTCPGRDAYPALLTELADLPAADAAGDVWFFSEAGASMIRTAKKVSAEGLTGLEFACGIPGTVGGALYMNAGAYDGSTEQVAAISYYLDHNYEIQAALGDEQQFAYRSSFFQRENMIILGCCYRLHQGEQPAIDEKIADLTARREKSQPLELPSCGSVFKRPPGYFAGKLITDCGLRGFRIGGAEVSLKHAGFIVNQGGATAADVAAVIAHVKKTVKEQFGVQLETEVRFTGDWDERP